MGNQQSAGSLNKKEIEQYQRLTKLSQEEIQEWHRGFHKDCVNGKLTKEQFRSIFICYFRLRHAKAFCDAIFKICDQDGDNALTFGEFLLALSPTTQLPFEAHLGLLFDVYDTSRDGQLDKKELQKLIKNMYKFVDSPESVDAEQIEDIANEIIESSKKLLGNKPLDKNAFITACLKNPTIKQLLAPCDPCTHDNISKQKSTQTNVSTYQAGNTSQVYRAKIQLDESNSIVHRSCNKNEPKVNLASSTRIQPENGVSISKRNHLVPSNNGKTHKRRMRYHENCAPDA